MDGHGEARTNALMKCAEAALDMKMKIFALQNGGECMAEEDGERKYDQLGMSNLCHGKYNLELIWTSGIKMCNPWYDRLIVDQFCKL